MSFEIAVSIDIMGGRTVRLEKGSPEKPTYYPHTPVEYARHFSQGRCDRLHVVDLDAALGRGRNTDIIAGVVAASKKPVQVAGGIRRMETAEEVFKTGASKIVISSLIFTDEGEAAKILARYGGRRVVAALDVRADGGITVHGWRRDIGLNLLDALQHVLELGFEEIILTDTSRDGTLQGVSTQLMEKVPAKLRGRIHVAGGIAGEDDLSTLKGMGFAGAVLGKAVYEGLIKIL
ncbi:1-(5-phosphoribosyl)-5-[(5-phosphoribosylamino) methylideneamino] imidazole-4-carboxamide isomerase [archaeon HR01]|nr:1-(5-phosphoribosyl)-5-[(5-phosphoribosylamino) methylideneamino] imidazole-4-carboxamide isomerase [archaeon HR01]